MRMIIISKLEIEAMTDQDEVSSDDQKAEPKLRVFESKELFGDARQIEITHGQRVYRLMKTKFGKLILTK